MLKCENIYKKYGSVVALDDVSLEFRPGEIVGLLGENGAGKTTLMKTILSYIRPNKGRVTLDGEKIGPNNIDRIAFATSEHSFFGGLDALEHKAFYHMQFERFNEKRFDSLLEFFELPKKTKIKNFSTGQKNQFEVILALSQGADYILMDEPFAGNDIFNREDFYKVLLGILDDNECLILSTHLIEEIKNFISRAVLLHKGQLIGDVTTLELDDKNIDLMEYMRKQYSYRSDRVIETLMKNEK
ncbi:MAG: ABC transporter ATP-binding protein [Clostridiales bacterium]|nr:ABC transporter ATP-binding protein [Clostridiales bacterium]